MLALGWRMDGPWSWVAPGGDEFALPDELRTQAHMTDGFRQEVANSISLKLWASAASFRNGAGGAEGVDFTVARSHLARLRKKDTKKRGAAQGCFNWCRLDALENPGLGR